MKQRLVECQQALSNRTNVHINTLSALENTIYKLGGECAKLQAANEGLLSDMNAIRVSFFLSFFCVRADVSSFSLSGEHERVC